jgi:hypothetical protein
MPPSQTQNTFWTLCLMQHNYDLTFYFTYMREAITFLENIPVYLQLNEGNEGVNFTLLCLGNYSLRPVILPLLETPVEFIIQNNSHYWDFIFLNVLDVPKSLSLDIQLQFLEESKIIRKQVCSYRSCSSTTTDCLVINCLVSWSVKMREPTFRPKFTPFPMHSLQ